MAANRGARSVVSALNHNMALHRPRLHLQLASGRRTQWTIKREPVFRPPLMFPLPPKRRFMSLDTILDLTNIPPPYVQAFIHSRKEEFDLRSPEEYYATLLAYCEHVRSHETPIPDTRHTNKLPGVEVLHDLGCIVMEASRGTKADLSLSLWSVAGNWGFAPSTCSAVSYLVRINLYRKLEVFQPLEKRFRALVASGCDPITMAIQGEVLFAEKSYTAAENGLRTVLRDPGSLGNWEPKARLALGKTLARRGKTHEALAILSKLSQDGYIEADEPLGEVLRNTNPDEALRQLYQAGCAGTLSSFNLMAAIELTKATEAKTSSDAEHHRKWAQELTRLADKRAEY